MAMNSVTSEVARNAGELLWNPSNDDILRSRVGQYCRWLERERSLTFDDYNSLWQWSVSDLPGFWQSIWDYFGVIAHSEPAAVITDSRMPGAKWFPGATLNYAEHALRGPDRDVVIAAYSQTRSPIEMTRADLRGAVGRAAVGLERLGIGPGDRVAGYLPNIPEAVIALLATASLGAIWVACAPEFGVQSVLDRFSQVEPKVLIAVDGYRYGEKEIDRERDLVTISNGLPSVVETVHVPYLRETTLVGFSWSELLATPGVIRFTPVAFDHPLWILFSSGTTGLPKAITHSHGGILIEQFKALALGNDIGPHDRYFVFCTTSWVMWNILVSGLIVGARIVLMDGNPMHPDELELWRIVERSQATIFACGATFLVHCRKHGVEPARDLDLSKLRTVSSTGSPLPADGFRWIYKHVSPSVYLQSGSGGTDVCTGFVGGSHMLPVRAGEIAGRCLGVQVDALSSEGEPLVGELGELVVSAPMPSMPICFWNDPDDERYRAAYFSKYPGRWRHGDWIIFTERGSCIITGRSDGTLNRGGVRLGSSEFYTVMDDFDEVVDSLVVHLEDESGGLGQLLLFVQLEAGCSLDEGTRARIARELRIRLSPRHVPDKVYEVPLIPYNLSGKKLEIPVKQILKGNSRSTVVSDGSVRDATALEAFEQLSPLFGVAHGLHGDSADS